ncbi:MAG: class I SAM-dependent rRNA methyltransferase [Planctomycetota bacterium]
MFYVTSTQIQQVRLKPGRQFPFLARHPWVHAHALATETSEAFQRGDVVDVVDMDGNFLARGLVNPASRLRVRLYAFDDTTEIGPELWKSRIDAAIRRRKIASPAGPNEAERLVFSEADLLSGLIVDRYADCLGVQFTAGALMRFRGPILEELQKQTGCRQIVVRVDEKTAKFEGVEPEQGTHAIENRPLDGPVRYQQNGLQLEVDLEGGQKTGGYLDQRVNHDVSANYLRGKRILDVCCYTGGFGLVAAHRGAEHVTSIDTSAAAIDAARAAAERNGVIDRMTFVREDCFDALKRLVDEGQSFDGVVLDPPRFAGTRHQVEQAIRAYTRLNAQAIDLLPSGGVLITCSCSGRVSRSDFMNMLADVGRKRKRDVILLENRGPAPDHPLAIACPESNYLKCVIAQIV